jgi:hypothetical protein
VALAALTLWWIVSRLDGDPQTDLHLHQRAAFYYSLGSFLLGAQFMTVGFLAELITAYARPESLTYSVKERTGPSDA